MFAGISLASDPANGDLIAPRSPASGNKAVSKAIDDALAKAGFNATEAEKLRGAYHVGINQIDDDSDKSRQLLDSALGKILNQADVKKVDDALDVLIGQLGGLVSRDVDAADAAAASFPAPPKDDEAARKLYERIKENLEKLHPELKGPKIPDGCNCKKTIDAVKQPKPEGGMTYEWYLNWEHKNLITTCVQPCVGQAIKMFTEKLQGYQKREIIERHGWIHTPAVDPYQPHSKREEASEQSEQESKTPVAQLESPQTGNLESYRAWCETTQKSGKYCTCAMKKPTIWDYFWRPKTSRRCSKFCKNVVGPWLEKENATLATIPRPIGPVMLPPQA